MQYVYQIQIKRDSGWDTVINSVTGRSVQFEKYENALNMAKILRFHHPKVRIIKYKFKVVEVLKHV